jgi:cell division control protein 6
MLGFHPEAVEMEIMDLISDIGSEWGDARYVIEILDTAGMLADESNDKVVTSEHVRRARAETNPTDIWEKLTPLDRHKKLLLLAIARNLKKETYATTGNVEKTYKLICEEFNEKARGHTQLWKYLKDLDAHGMIEAKKSSRGVTGTTTLISLPDVPAQALEERLTKIVKPRKTSK